MIKVMSFEIHTLIPCTLRFVREYIKVYCYYHISVTVVSVVFLAQQSHYFSLLEGDFYFQVASSSQKKDESDKENGESNKENEGLKNYP